MIASHVASDPLRSIAIKISNAFQHLLFLQPSKRPKTTDTRRRASHGGVSVSGVHPTPHTTAVGGDVKRTRPGQARRLISADATSLQTANKSRYVPHNFLLNSDASAPERCGAFEALFHP